MDYYLVWSPPTHSGVYLSHYNSKAPRSLTSHLYKEDILFIIMFKNNENAA